MWLVMLLGRPWRQKRSSVICCDGQLVAADGTLEPEFWD